jgi:hypothetical protein
MPNGLWRREISERRCVGLRPAPNIFKSTAGDNREAQRLFRRAIELDPSLAGAWFLSYSIVLSMIYFDAEPMMLCSASRCDRKEWCDSR